MGSLLRSLIALIGAGTMAAAAILFLPAAYSAYVDYALIVIIVFWSVFLECFHWNTNPKGRLPRNILRAALVIVATIILHPLNRPGFG